MCDFIPAWGRSVNGVRRTQTQHWQPQGRKGKHVLTFLVWETRICVIPSEQSRSRESLELFRAADSTRRGRSLHDRRIRCKHLKFPRGRVGGKVTHNCATRNDVTGQGWPVIDAKQSYVAAIGYPWTSLSLT